MSKRWPSKWAGKVWSGVDGQGGQWSLTEKELRRARSALGSSRRILAALGVGSRTHRKFDRAMQLLRSEGMARYDRSSKEWVKHG